MKSADRRAEWRDAYRTLLEDDILPFWLRHAPDREAGGYATCLARDGSIFDQDKRCMWSQGRIAWTFSYLYNEWRHEKSWLDMARLGIDFIHAHGFNPAGEMYYSLTREGKPLLPPMDVYAALSTVCAYTEYARASGQREWHDRARSLFEGVWERFQKPGRAYQPFLAETRPVRKHGNSMITINVLQELRRFNPDPVFDERIDQCIRQILDYHLRADRKLIFESVGWDGEDLPGTTGRWVNPGHMIECGIFFIHEGRHRQRQEWIDWGIRFIDWGFEWGWDKEFGGIYNDVDCEGLPVPDAAAYTYSCKLWWQHAEGLYGALLAAHAGGETRFEDIHAMVYAYVQEHFADPHYGEWFGLLDRRGNRINDAKGLDRKNTYHLCRNAFHAYRLLCEWTGVPIA